MIRSGAIASTVELQADDLGDDDTVAVRYFGAERCAVPSSSAGGRSTARYATRTARRPRTCRARPRCGCRSSSRRTRSRSGSTGSSSRSLPPDDDGGGGYLATLHGAMENDERDIFSLVHRGITQMVASNPGPYLVLARCRHRPRRDDLRSPRSSPSRSCMRCSRPIFSGCARSPGRFLSFGFQVHLAPRARRAAPPPSRRRTRATTGCATATDVRLSTDGGSCPLACAASLACSVPDDRQSLSCAAGACAAATCTDGIRDGFESDLDCGGRLRRVRPEQAVRHRRGLREQPLLPTLRGRRLRAAVVVAPLPRGTPRGATAARSRRGRRRRR